jgi:hypothetical protein
MLLMEGVYCLASHRTVVMYLEIIRIAFTLTTAPESQLLSRIDWLFKIRTKSCLFSLVAHGSYGRCVYFIILLLQSCMNLNIFYIVT